MVLRFLVAAGVLARQRSPRLGSSRLGIDNDDVLFEPGPINSSIGASASIAPRSPRRDTSTRDEAARIVRGLATLDGDEVPHGLGHRHDGRDGAGDRRHAGVRCGELAHRFCWHRRLERDSPSRPRWPSRRRCPARTNAGWAQNCSGERHSPAPGKALRRAARMSRVAWDFGGGPVSLSVEVTSDMCSAICPPGHRLTFLECSRLIEGVALLRALARSRNAAGCGMLRFATRLALASEPCAIRWTPDARTRCRGRRYSSLAAP